jgi:hypothetical protein
MFIPTVVIITPVATDITALGRNNGGAELGDERF